MRAVERLDEGPDSLTEELDLFVRHHLMLARKKSGQSTMELPAQ